MSGGLSAPFTALAVFADSKSGKIIWAALALSALFIMLYRVWVRTETRILELEEISRTKLKLSYGKDLPGCLLHTPRYLTSLSERPLGSASIWSSAAAHTYTAIPTLAHLEQPEILDRGIYHRLLVETDHIESVTGCSAHLVSLIFNGREQLLGDEILLTFARAENPDTLNKTIHNQKAEYVDFLYLTNDNRAIVPSYRNVFPGSIKPDKLIHLPGEYLINIVIISSQPTVSKRLNIKWLPYPVGAGRAPLI